MLIYIQGKNQSLKKEIFFKIVIPLNQTFSFDKEIGSDTIPNTISDTVDTNSIDFLERIIEKILTCVKEKPAITQAELGEKNISLVSVKRAMKELYRRGRLERVDSNRKGF